MAPNSCLIINMSWYDRSLPILRLFLDKYVFISHTHTKIKISPKFSCAFWNVKFYTQSPSCLFCQVESPDFMKLREHNVLLSTWNLHYVACVGPNMGDKPKWGSPLPEIRLWSLPGEPLFSCCFNIMFTPYRALN